MGPDAQKIAYYRHFGRGAASTALFAKLSGAPARRPLWQNPLVDSSDTIVADPQATC